MVNLPLLGITQNGANFVLTGPYVQIAEIEPPTTAPPSVATANGFTFARSNPAFRATNAYRAIDAAARYIHGTLGFPNVMNYAMQVDVDGVSGDDNSHYSGNGNSQGYIAYGRGGVPDAEDCDIVLHEMGHAIQDNQTNGFYLYTGADGGSGNQAGAMGEGFGDFWAAALTFDKSVASGFDPAAVGEWDATAYSAANPPNLRRVDGNKIFPTDIQNEVHDDGEIWSAALWNVFITLNTSSKRDQMLRIVLQSQMMVPDKPSFNQGGHALIDANTQLLNIGVIDLRP